MPQPADVLSYHDYEFEDGSKRDKLFVILNELTVGTPCLLLKTTSQSRRYEGAKRGCNQQKKVFFVPSAWGDCFPLDTYIQLPQVIELSTEEFLTGALSKRIRVVSMLLPVCFQQLKDCLKQFKMDISPQHWALIFQS